MLHLTLKRAGVTNSHSVTQQNYVNSLVTWNVRGINGTVKREKVVDVLKEGKFELPALMETKLKGKGDVSWCGVNGIIASIQEMERARKGVAILFNDVWHKAVVDLGVLALEFSVLN